LGFLAEQLYVDQIQRFYPSISVCTFEQGYSVYVIPFSQAELTN